MQGSVSSEIVIGEAFAQIAFAVERVVERINDVLRPVASRIGLILSAFYSVSSRLRQRAGSLPGQPAPTFGACIVENLHPDVALLTPALRELWAVLDGVPQTARDLAKRLGLSAGCDGAIRQRVRQLKKRGCQIGHRPAMGYYRLELDTP